MRRACGGRIVDQLQRHALNVATKRNCDVITNHAFYARLAIATRELRAVADKEIDGVAAAF